MTTDYTGPCIDLIPRCRVAEVTRGGRVEAVAMPAIDTTHDEPSGRRVVITQPPQQGDI